MSFSTCDICDANEEALAQGALAVLPPVFKRYGAHVAFSGPAVTIKVFEDNGLVRSTLETQGHGKVLVVDGGGSLRCALVGGSLAKLAEKNGWVGVVDGCVRDTLEMQSYAIGIRALATHPQRCAIKGMGQRDVRVAIAGVAVHPDDWIYADIDGVLVARDRLG
jgi:regulator of ribonuclease activity A